MLISFAHMQYGRGPDSSLPASNSCGLSWHDDSN